MQVIISYTRAERLQSSWQEYNLGIEKDNLTCHVMKMFHINSLSNYFSNNIFMATN